jgi:hypothetical protein
MTNEASQVPLETALLMDYCERVRENLQRFDLAEKGVSG